MDPMIVGFLTLTVPPFALAALIWAYLSATAPIVGQRYMMRGVGVVTVTDYRPQFAVIFRPDEGGPTVDVSPMVWRLQRGALITTEIEEALKVAREVVKT